MRIASQHGGGVLALAALALSASGLCTVALAAGTPVASARKSAASPSPVERVSSLLHSRELWATVDVCNPADQPDTIGVRGSMPGDGDAKDAMYMRFQLQYLEAKGGVWVYLAHGADSGFVAVGPAKSARQGGSSFQLGAVKGVEYTLRGVVTFQWRQHGRVVHQVVRTTSASHQSVAGADPAGYSAAECKIP
jgi:hypothetical protein